MSTGEIIRVLKENLSSDDLDYLTGLARHNLYFECFIKHSLFKFWGVDNHSKIQICITDFYETQMVGVASIQLSDIGRTPLP